jgi:HSP20 family protein
MALVRLDPFREVEGLQQEMNRLFDDFFPTQRRGRGIATTFAPAAELEETADAYLLKLELPGMKKEDLDIQVTAEAVSVSGERKSEIKSEDQGMTRTEFRYGKFQRVIPLPNRIDHQNVTANYTDGILNLTLPKAESEKSKVVKVNIG